MLALTWKLAPFHTERALSYSTSDAVSKVPVKSMRKARVSVSSVRREDALSP